MLLVSGTTKTVARLAAREDGWLGRLPTPSNHNRASVLAAGLPFGVDNGAYRGLSPAAFRRLLAWLRDHAERCLWAVCPDVVGDARGTLRLFAEWRGEVAAAAPVAFVGQDGAEDEEIPWGEFAAWFIGGSTAWKLSQAAADLAAEARQRGKWVHVGRVNSLRRMRAAYDMGCGSIDGSSASMFGDKYIHKYCRWLRQLHRQRTLFGGCRSTISLIGKEITWKSASKS